jgi:hypothetical protein
VIAAAIVAGAASPAASAAYAPRFTATAGADRSLTLDYTQKGSDDGAAALLFYVPARYAPKLATAPGTVVGSAFANAVAADAGGSTLTMPGSIRVAAATTALTNGTAATAGEAARACIGSDSSVVLWVASLSGFAQRVDLTLAVHRVDSGPLAGRLAIAVCPAPADVAAGTAGRAPLGLKIVRLALRLESAFTVPAGVHTWHLRATPYTPKSAAANAAGALELEAQHGLPQTLTLTTRRAASGRVRVSGRLTLGGKPVAGATVSIRGGGVALGTAKTNARGAYAATVAARRTLGARAVVPARYFSSCLEPALAPLPCVSSIRAGFVAASRSVRVPA